MAEYEVELGRITEHRDAKTQELFEVTVDIYVQAATPGGAVGDLDSADHDVTFDIDDGRATLRAIEAEPAFTDLALVALTAAANEVDDLQDVYEVVDPVAAAVDGEYTVVDR